MPPSRAVWDAAAQQAAMLTYDFRYGQENKDYVWITDHQPVMIMHPYVSELEGQDHHRVFATRWYRPLLGLCRRGRGAER